MIGCEILILPLSIPLFYKEIEWGNFAMQEWKDIENFRRICYSSKGK